MTFELPLDDYYILYADVTEVDASFDHEFGREKRTELEIENLQLYYVPLDIWSAPLESEIEYLKGKIEEKYWMDKTA